MINDFSKEFLLPYLVVCVTFFYAPERLNYLHTVISNYVAIASRIQIYIITNVSNYTSIESILGDLPANMSVEFVTPSRLGHPYLLSWIHREVFEEVVASGEASHFLYTEDDLLLNRSNIIYWLQYREALQEHGLIPSFFRVELDRDENWVSTDCTSPICFSEQPNLLLEDGTVFLNMPNPYQGLYFLDQPLMQEFVNSLAMSPDFGIWNIREKAAQGLTFVNIPEGCYSRNFVKVDLDKETVAQEAWIHHLPNNYARNKNTPYGKVLMTDLFVLEKYFS